MASKRTCEAKKNVCWSRKAALKRYTVARHRLARAVGRLNRAARMLRRGRSNLSKRKTRRLRRIVRRNRALARRLRKLLARARHERKAIVAHCRKLTVQCRSAVFRYQTILRERVQWTKSKLALWEKRVHEASQAVESSHEPEDKKHAEIAEEHAKQVVRELKAQLHSIASRRAAWQRSRRHTRAYSWRKTIDAWKKNAHCKATQMRIALHELGLFNRAAAEAKSAIHHDDEKTYRSALARAQLSAENRHHALRIAAACGHKASYLLSRARESAVRRAQQDAAKRLVLLKHARAEYEIAQKSKSKEELKTYHAALVRAHRLATRAHLDLKQAHILSEKAKAEEQAIESAQAAAIVEEGKHAEKVLESAKREAWISAHRRIKSRFAQRREERIRAHDLFRARKVHSARTAAADYRAQHSLFRQKIANSQAFAVASVTGDPHMKTFSGAALYLGGHGDYVLYRGDDFELQGRVRVANKDTHATYVAAIAIQLGGHKGDVVEIAADGVAVNGKLRELAEGKTSLVGGSLFKGKDEKGIEYVKVSLENGVFVTANYGVHSTGLTALNVAVASPSNLLSDSLGLLNPREEMETADIEESNKAPTSLFRTRYVEETAPEAKTSLALVSLDSMESAEELCRSAFSTLSEVWSKCPKACIADESGHCLVDPTLLGNLDDAERRACQCVFDVAAAGSPWAQADARGAVLEDDAKKASGFK